MQNETIVFPEPRSVAIEGGDIPDFDSSEVLVETDCSLISPGTELTVLSGNFPAESRWDDYGSYPFTAGYCNVGTVMDTGADVDDSWIGRRVATRAPHTRYSAIDPNDGLCVPVPKGVSSEEAAFFALAGIVMNGVRRSRLEWGEDVAIYGLGLIGQLAARFCHISGAQSIVGFDLAESRVEFLPDDVIVDGYDPETIDPEMAVADAARSEQADVVFEATGVPSAVSDQFDVLRPCGRFVVLSSPRGPTELDLHDYCNGPSYEIIGAHELSHTPNHQGSDWSYNQRSWTHSEHYELFFDYLTAERLTVEPLVSHRVSVDDAPSMYEQLLEDRIGTLGVIIEW